MKKSNRLYDGHPGYPVQRCARIILSGTETMHMIRKAQMKDDGVSRTAAEQFFV